MIERRNHEEMIREAERSLVRPSEFLIIFDEDNCAVRPEKAAELAGRFDEVRPLLTTEQQLIVVENLLMGDLLPAARAEEIVKSFDEENQVRILKYIGKILKLGAYDDVVFRVVAALPPGRKNEVINFFANEAPDRYADVALYDVDPLPVPIDQPRDVKKLAAEAFSRGHYAWPDYEQPWWSAPNQRLDKLVTTTEQATVLAGFANRRAEAGESDAWRGKPVFEFLLERFPEVLVPHIARVREYRLIEGSDEDILRKLFQKIPNACLDRATHYPWRQMGHITKAMGPLQAARREEHLGGKTRQRRADIMRRRDQAVMAERYAALEATVMKNFTRELTREQREQILSLEHDWSTLDIIVRHVDLFRDADRELLRRAIDTYFTTNGQFTDEIIRVLKAKGLTTQLDRYLERYGTPSRLAPVFVSGGIELLGEERAAALVKEFDVTHLPQYLENPALYKKYGLRPPRELLERLTARDPTSLQYTLDNFRRYVQYVRGKISSADPYYLGDDELKRAWREALYRAPLSYIRHAKEISESFGNMELKKFFMAALIKAPDKDDSNYLAFPDVLFRSSWHLYGPLINQDAALRELLKARLAAGDPLDMFQHWLRVRESVITDAGERETFIKKYADQILEGPSYQTRSVWLEIAGEARLAEFMLEYALKNKPEFVARALARAGSVRAVRPDLWREGHTAMLRSIRENPRLIMEQTEEIESLAKEFPEEVAEIIRIADASFALWCASAPEDVANRDDFFLALFGRERFHELVRENQGALARVFFDYFNFNKLTNAADRAFMHEMGAEIFERFPAVAFRNNGELTEGGTELEALKNKDVRAEVWRVVSTQKLFPFYEKRLRNLQTVSKKLPYPTVEPEFVELVERVGTLSASPAADLFFYAAESVTRREAERLLLRASVLVSLRRDTAFARSYEYASEPRAIARAIDAEIIGAYHELLGVETPSTADSPILDRPAPILVFARQHRDDSKIIALLKAMVDAEFNGRFMSWRYYGNEGGRAGFEALQAKKLLPEKLTFEQYERFVEDDEEPIVLDVSFNLEDLTRGNSNIVEDALRFQHVDADAGMRTFEPDRAALELAALEAPLRELDRTTKEFKEYLAANGHEIKIRRAYLYLARLLHLTMPEAAAGVINLSSKKGGDLSFRKVFDLLRDVFADKPDFINDIGKIEANITTMTGAGDRVRQQLVATDRTELLTAMEIGEKPVATCQHYDRGGYNQSLPAYAADPNMKLFTVRGERGQLIARSAGRLLSAPDGSPVLHLDTVYSSNPSPEIKKTLVAFAYRKTRRMRIPLTHGHDDLPQGFRDTSKVDLQSFASRNRSVYIDSGGGSYEDGVFTVKEAKVIEAR